MTLAGHRQDNITLAASSGQAGYRFETTRELADPLWDAFLEHTPGGYYAQSSLWAQVKASLGWQVVRIKLISQQQIIAGVQILARPIPLVGAAGYVPRGPVQAQGHPAWTQQLLDQMCESAREHRHQVLLMQPADQAINDLLLERGFRLTKREVAPLYTLQLDLSASPDDLLAGMERGTRYNIHLSQRKEIAVREGTAADLPAFCQLLRQTGERQGFAVSPPEFFDELWRLFAPGGHVKLYVAQYAGEIVSAQLMILFGDHAVNKFTVWSGAHGNRKPNEAVMWAAIMGARQAGYRCYDFGGLSYKVAQPVLRGEPLPERQKGSVGSFKLRFGGQVVAYPPTHLLATNPLVRWLDDRLTADAENSRLAKNYLHRLRTR
jgi:lipid II:glycine glycyltransferase (peptidoglycan interpeptide bridge formation enzyme)